MKIYIPASKDGYEFCHPKKNNGFEDFRNFINGVMHSTNWCNIPVKIIEKDGDEWLSKSDSPWLGSHALIFREEILGKISSILDQFGEFLPLDCDYEKLVVYNPQLIEGGLDEKKSEITRFSDGRIMSISKYFFVLDSVKNIDAFKIPNLKVSPTFVSEKFVELWNDMDLKGLKFNLVWESL